MTNFSIFGKWPKSSSREMTDVSGRNATLRKMENLHAISACKKVPEA